MHSAHDPLHVDSPPRNILRCIRNTVPCISVCGAPSTHGADVHSGSSFTGGPRFGVARSGPHLACTSRAAQLGQLFGSIARRHLRYRESTYRYPGSRVAQSAPARQEECSGNGDVVRLWIERGHFLRPCPVHSPAGVISSPNPGQGNGSRSGPLTLGHDVSCRPRIDEG